MALLALFVLSWLCFVSNYQVTPLCQHVVTLFVAKVLSCLLQKCCVVLFLLAILFVILLFMIAFVFLASCCDAFFVAVLLCFFKMHKF